MAAADFDEFVNLRPRYQYGSGLFFRGSPRPRIGAGIGSFLINFFRPVLRRALPAAMDVVSKVATDAVEGHNVKDSFKKHAAAKVADVLGKIGDQQSSQVPITSPAVLLSKGKRVLAAQRRPVSKVKRKSGVTGSGIRGGGKLKISKKAKTIKNKHKKKLSCDVRDDSKEFPALRYM